MQRVRISDIADEVNVSRNTVSKVFNNRGHVSEHTREKIIRAAIDLGYEKIPEEWINERQVKNILVIATAPDYSYYWGEIINGIIDELEEEKYNCFYHFLSPQQIRDFTIPHMLEGNEISGIIIMNVYEPKAVELINGLNIPTVYFDIPLECDNWDIKADVISVEGRRSIMKITKDFIDQGLEEIGFIGDITYCKSICERWYGFKQMMTMEGLEINKDHCLTQSPGGRFYCPNELSNQMDKMFGKNISMPQAFVCANDAIAYKLISKLEKEGYKVPEDVKVSGFDGIENNENKDKLSSTVKVETKYIGSRLAEQIVWRIENKDRQYETIKINGDIVWNHKERGE